MLVTRQIPAVFNGISQQPPAVRSPSQWEEQVNATSSVVDGVRKRGPLEMVAKVSEDRFGTAMVHTINRDPTERYQVVVTSTGIRVFTMTGEERTVTAPLGWDYLALPAEAEARYAYSMMTVADYTFVVNKSKVVELLDVGADLSPPTDDFWWLNRALSNAPSAMIKVFDPEGPEGGGGGGGGGGSGGGSPPPPPASSGGIAANPAGTLVGTVQTLQDLPTSATTGQVYKVIGTNESDFSSYYVIRAAGGYWNETVLPGLKNLIDPHTMPHALIRQEDGTFVFGPFAWAARHVGDEKSNPNPTFVGRAIRDVFFSKNRLGFLVAENAVLSRTGDFGNFYRLTVVDNLPDDVIDIAASENQVTRMEYAVPFQGSISLFSEQVQLKLSWDGPLSAAGASLESVTHYPAVPGVRPVTAGADVYFPSQGAGYGQLREYFVTSDTDEHDASNVSAHVPSYLPNSITQIVAAGEYDFIGVKADAYPNRIYVYQYYWSSGTEKAQSAWNHWEFPSGTSILSMSSLGGYLYLLVDRDDGTYLERVPLFYGSAVAGLRFQVYLDRRAAVTGTYDAANDRTTFTVPYAVPEDQRDDFRLVFGSAFEGQQGATRSGTEITWVNSSTIRVAGNRTAGPCAVGLVYECRLVPSRQYAQNSRGEPVHTGRLQLKTFSAYLTDSAYLRVEVRPHGPNTEPVYHQEFPTRRPSVIGMDGFGDPVFADDKVTFAVQANAAAAEITFINDSHLGFCINALEWEGFYWNRARA